MTKRNVVSMLCLVFLFPCIGLAQQPAVQPAETVKQETTPADPQLTVEEQLKILREQNELLRQRVEALESQAGPARMRPATMATAAAKSGPEVWGDALTTEAAAADAAKSAPTDPAPPQQAAAPNPIEDQFRRFQFFGTFGMRYHGFFNRDTLPGLRPITNRPEVMIRLGAAGQLHDRVFYRIRFTTGVTSNTTDSWVALADAASKRGVSFDQYNIAYLLQKGERFSQTIVAGKVTDIPTILGTSDLIFDEDFALSVLSNTIAYKVNNRATLTFLGGAGFGTNTGSDLLNPNARRLNPPVSIPPNPLLPSPNSGLISDIAQDGSPRAIIYAGQVAGNFGLSKTTSLRTALTFINVAHVNDVATAVAATNLFGSDGARVAGLPDGFITNLPGVLPVDANGVVPITGVAVPVALLTSQFASAYRLLDTYASLTLRVGSKWPLRLWGDYVRNLGAGDNIPGPATPGSLKQLARDRADGLVLGLDLGNLSKVGNFDFNYRYVLIESDATVASGNNDQWHTNIRGHDLRVRYNAAPNITPFFSIMVSQDYDPRLIGFSDLATFPVTNQAPGRNPTAFRPRAGILFTF